MFYPDVRQTPTPTGPVVLKANNRKISAVTWVHQISFDFQKNLISNYTEHCLLHQWSSITFQSPNFPEISLFWTILKIVKASVWSLIHDHLFTAPFCSGNVLIYNYSESSFTLAQLLCFSYLVFADMYKLPFLTNRSIILTMPKALHLIYMKTSCSTSGIKEKFSAQIL